MASHVPYKEITACQNFFFSKMAVSSLEKDGLLSLITDNTISSKMAKDVFYTILKPANLPLRLLNNRD